MKLLLLFFHMFSQMYVVVVDFVDNTKLNSSDVQGSSSETGQPAKRRCLLEKLLGNAFFLALIITTLMAELS